MDNNYWDKYAVTKAREMERKLTDLSEPTKQRSKKTVDFKQCLLDHHVRKGTLKAKF